MYSEERVKIIKSLIFPAILLLVIWAVKFFEIIFAIDLSEYGIYPQHPEGLRGIIFSPLLHSDFKHLSANSLPLFLLTAGLFYFYEKASIRIFILSWLITGFWVWIFAKDTGIHIGASGVVYALAAFHFTSGLLRRNAGLMAFSLLIVFLYGGLVWGIFPQLFPDQNISWESHLLGLLAGFILAFFFRDAGPQSKRYDWEDEDDEIPGDPGENTTPDDPDHDREKADQEIKVIYHLPGDKVDKQPE